MKIIVSEKDFIGTYRYETFAKKAVKK